MFACMRHALQARRGHYGVIDGSAGGDGIAAGDGGVPRELGQRLASIERKHSCWSDESELRLQFMSSQSRP